MKRAFLAVLACGLLVGCSSMTVNTDYSVDADFSKFETFAYRDSSNTVQATSPLAHQRIIAALKDNMSKSGLTLVDGEPDVYVSYYGSTTEQLQFHTSYLGVNNWAHRGMGMGVTSATTRTTTVTEGTLVIDVWETDGDDLVWRAVASAPLSDNPDRNTAAINRAVERAFNDFPPQ